MADTDRSVKDELNEALMLKAKELLFHRLDDETIRRFIVEEAVKDLHEFLNTWELRQAIRRVVASKVDQRIPGIVDELLAREDFKALLADAVSSAFKDGINEGAQGLKRRLSRSLSEHF